MVPVWCLLDREAVSGILAGDEDGDGGGGTRTCLAVRATGGGGHTGLRSHGGSGSGIPASGRGAGSVGEELFCCHYCCGCLCFLNHYVFSQRSITYSL